jgi:hypothetical protein
MSTFKAGILAITVLVLLAYFGFTKANPFANPYELKAMFRDVESLKPRSPASRWARSRRSSRRTAAARPR